MCDGCMEEMTSKKKKLRVIVVDDIPSMRTLVVQFLKKNHGVEIIGDAKTGDEALALVSKTKPDILLIDLSLPDRSGLDVAREVKLNHPTVSVYLFSAYDIDEIRNLNNGGVPPDGFIHKSNLKAELETMIKKETSLRL